MIVGRELAVSGVRCMTILAQIFLAFSELKFATNCTIKHKYTDQNQCGNTTEYRRLVIVFAAIVMPYFENCRTFASYIFACTLLAEFAFHRGF